VPKNVILLLVANPSGTSRLALDEECTAIKHELRMTAHRNDSVATALTPSPRQHTGPWRHETSAC